MREYTAKVIIGDMGDIGTELSTMFALEPKQTQTIIDMATQSGRVQILNKGSHWLIHDENTSSFSDDQFILITDIERATPYLGTNGKIRAIKEIRSHYNITLIDAKNVVDVAQGYKESQYGHSTITYSNHEFTVKHHCKHN